MRIYNLKIEERAQERVMFKSTDSIWEWLEQYYSEEENLDTYKIEVFYYQDAMKFVVKYSYLGDSGQYTDTWTSKPFELI